MILDTVLGKKVTVVIPYERVSKLVKNGDRVYQPVKALIYETRQSRLGRFISYRTGLRLFTLLVNFGESKAGECSNLLISRLEEDCLLRQAKPKVPEHEIEYCKAIEPKLI